MYAQCKIYITALLCMLACLCACPSYRAYEAADAPKPDFSLVQASNKKFDNDLACFGSIAIRTKNDITVRVQGIINNVFVKEGSLVTAGQAIASLQNVQLEIQKEQYENALRSGRAALAMAEARLEEASLAVEGRYIAMDKKRLELEQLELELAEEQEILKSKKDLYELGGITEAAYRNLQLSRAAKEAGISILKKEMEISELGLRDIDLLNAGLEIPEDYAKKKRAIILLNTRSAEAELVSARAALANAEKSLDSIMRLISDLTVRSATNGTIAAIYFQKGEHVSEYEKLATVMDSSRLFAIFYIQEEDITGFEIGSPMTIEIPSLKKTIHSELEEISPLADPQSGNFIVKAVLENADLSIKPGMFAKCVIPRKNEEYYPVIPESALVKVGNSEGSVFCASNGFAVLKTVQLFAIKDGFAWIKNGLSEGETLVDKPSPFLKEGEKIYCNEK